MVLFVSALNAMHVVGCEGNISIIFPKGIINSNILLAFKTISNQRGLFNIISLEEQRKTSHVKNKLL